MVSLQEGEENDLETSQHDEPGYRYCHRPPGGPVIQGLSDRYDHGDELREKGDQADDWPYCREDPRIRSGPGD